MAACVRKAGCAPTFIPGACCRRSSRRASVTPTAPRAAIPASRRGRGSAADDIYAVGFDSASPASSIALVVHYDGVTWTRMPTSAASSLESVSGSGPGDVFATGTYGVILHFDGIRWTPMTSTTGQFMYGVWANGAYAIAVGSIGAILQWGRYCAPTESSCTNGEDDDCDGFFDCGDSDCAAASTCTSGGLCPNATTISCNSTTPGSNEAGPKNISQYGCTSWLEHGREAYYRFTAAASGSVTVTLTGVSADLDVVVVEQGAGGTCEPRNPGCVAASTTTGNETVTFTATAGTTYYVIVEGHGTNAGTFTLGMTCP